MKGTQGDSYFPDSRGSELAAEKPGLSVRCRQKKEREKKRERKQKSRGDPSTTRPSMGFHHYPTLGTLMDPESGEQPE